MRSDDRRRRRASEALSLAAAAGLGACGGSAHDLSVASQPLVVIHGHVDLTSLVRQHPEASLIGALVWAGIPSISPLCLAYDVPELKPACPDPYGVFYGSIERAAPVDQDGSFELDLPHLPMANVSIGDDTTRIAYGSIVVAEDVNGDGQISFARRKRGGGEGRRRIDLSPSERNPDNVVGATFYSLHAAQERIVFREGGFVADSNYYPAPGCGPPPPGFSIQRAPALSDTPAPPDACSFRASDSVVEVPPLPGADADALACRPLQSDFRVREAQEDEPLDDHLTPLCLDPGIVAAVAPGPCPRLLGWTLKGCEDNPYCRPPEFDHTALPPTWWPCH